MTDFATDPGTLKLPMTVEAMAIGLTCGTLSLGQLNWIFKELFAAVDDTLLEATVAALGVSLTAAEGDIDALQLAVTALEIAVAALSGGSGSSGSKTWWLDCNAVSDGTGTAASPFKYFASIAAVFQNGDTIRVCQAATGSQICKENIDWSTKHNGTLDGGGLVFQAFDAITPTWTVTATADVWMTPALQFNFGGIGAHDAALNKRYAGLFAGNVSCPTGVDQGGTMTDAAVRAALASAVDYSFEFRNGPVVGGNPSGRTYGFVQGGHDTYVKMPAGVNPNSLTWKIQQRQQPSFGRNWTFRGDITVFGGNASNGFYAEDPNLGGRINIWYPSNHGCIIPGAQGLGPRVFYKQATGAAGIAIHFFYGGTRRRMILLKEPVVYGYNNASFDTCFGGHGSNAGNDSGEGAIIDDALLINCTAIGGIGSSTPGASYGPLTTAAVFNRLKAYGMEIAGIGGTNSKFVDPLIVQSPTSTSGMIAPATTGTLTTVEGGSIICNQRNALTQGTSGTGTISFRRTNLMVGASVVIGGQWFGATTGTWNFDKCLMGAEGTSEARNILLAANGATVTVTNTVAPGLAWPSGTVLTDVQRTGRVGLRRDANNVLSTVERGLDLAIEERIIDGAWPLSAATDNTYAGTTEAFALTKKGIYTFGGTNPVSIALPKWTGLNAFTLTGLATSRKDYANSWVVAYGYSGANPIVRRHQTSDGPAAASVSIDMTAFAGKTISGRVNGQSGGKLWLGFTDGSIAEIDCAAGTATARTSGVSHPLLDGIHNGTTVLFVGSDVGNTVGGAVISTDSGATWAISLAAADATPVGIGAWGPRLRCAVFVNGYYVARGAKGAYLYSPTGLTATWTALAPETDADIRTMAADTLNKKIVCGGEPGLGIGYRGAPMIYIDANFTAAAPFYPTYDATSTAWTPGALATNTTSAGKTVAVVGAAVGDTVDVAYSAALPPGCHIWAEVTAVDTVTAWIRNEDAASQTPTAGSTIRVSVRSKTVSTPTINPASWKSQLITCPVSALGPRILFGGAIAVAPNTFGQWAVPGYFAQLATTEDPRGEWRREDWPLVQRTYLTDLSGPQTAYLLSA